MRPILHKCIVRLHQQTEETTVSYSMSSQNTRLIWENYVLSPNRGYVRADLLSTPDSLAKLLLWATLLCEETFQLT